MDSVTPPHEIMSDEIEQTIAPIDDNPADPIPAIAASLKLEAPPPYLGPQRAAKMMQCAGLRLAGLRLNEIAKRTGLAYGTVSNYLADARRHGVYKEDDAIATVKTHMRAKALDVIDELMDDDDKAIRGKFALETAKGLGELVQHQKQDVRGGGMAAGGNFDFTLNLVVTEPKRAVKDGDVIAGEIVGIPRTLGAADDDKDK